MTFKPQPYLLNNQVQHYAWGTQGADAFIPHFLGMEPIADTPYAELWMGTHPKAPSQVQLDDETVSLAAWVALYPQEILGPHVATAFNATWPFLFKILSIATPLSIQAHPNQTQAQALHAHDSEHYPDANHKPEIAIALSKLTALVGFKDFEGIVTTLKTYPEITRFIGSETVAALSQAREETQQRESVRQMWTALMQRAVADEAALAQALSPLSSRLAALPTPSDHEQLFLTARQIYTGADVGLLALFFLNLVHLERGQGVFLEPGIPHAYVKGTIVECMASSDNVVRVGLTPKFKDVTTLIDILTYELGAPPLLGGPPRMGDHAERVDYPVPVPEFQVQRRQLTAGTRQAHTRPNTPAIWLITAGKVQVGWGTESAIFERGQSILFPAVLRDIEVVVLEDVEVFMANVPVSNLKIPKP